MIGVFDSGSGGLTVLRAIRERAPLVDVVYFGDLKNAPYGNKSREELGALTVLGIQRLIDEGATEIVSACNSVSVSIVLPMFSILNLPQANIIEMVGPTLASFRGVTGRALVLATKATIDSGVYQQGFRMVGMQADGLAVPDLVWFIEDGASDDFKKESIRRALTQVSDATQYTHVVFGCTHFPLVRELFEQMLAEFGFSVVLIDPAEAVAEKVLERFSTSGKGETRFILSDTSEVFSALAKRFCCDSPNIRVL